MYDFTNFGQRLQELRKAKGLTQEDLAYKVGVSGQAVSKWENNQSYPDITLIPDLANIFDVDISFFFGKVQQSPSAGVKFPDSYQNLPLVHSTALVACYSNKTVASKGDSDIKFTDGSMAELATRLAVNNGPGNILFVGHDEEFQNFDSSHKNFEFGHSHDLDLTICTHCECEIVYSQDDKTRVSAKGSSKFIQSLAVEHHGNSLKIWQSRTDNSDNGRHDNQLLVELPRGNGCNHIQLKIDGSGHIVSEIQEFNTGSLGINGSGVINVKNFKESCTAGINGSGNIIGIFAKELNLSINGSGYMEWQHGQKARVSVNGSGEIKLGNVHDINSTVNGSGDIIISEISQGDVSFRIAGSGHTKINSGNCQKFDVDISGSGDIDATGLTATKAHIVLHQSGSVTLGRVIEGSTEQIRKKGTITILNRGAE